MIKERLEHLRHCTTNDHYNAMVHAVQVQVPPPPGQHPQVQQGTVICHRLAASQVEGNVSMESQVSSFGAGGQVLGSGMAGHAVGGPMPRVEMTQRNGWVPNPQYLLPSQEVPMYVAQAPVAAVRYVAPSRNAAPPVQFAEAPVGYGERMTDNHAAEAPDDSDPFEQDFLDCLDRAQAKLEARQANMEHQQVQWDITDFPFLEESPEL